MAPDVSSESMAAEDDRTASPGLLTEEVDSSVVSVPKASDVLADRLRQQILTGELELGARLPVERDLAAETRLSRTAVREALRILEIEGLVSIRPGRGGGSFVRRPDVHSVDRTLGLYMAARPIVFARLLEAREAMEPAGAELAARNRTDEDLEDLYRIKLLMEASFEDIPKFLRRNVEWHVAVVKASGNDLMHAFILSVSKAIQRGTPLRGFHTERIRHEMLTAHEKVLDAIVKKDEALARHAMTRHVAAFRSEVTELMDPEEVSLTADEY